MNISSRTPEGSDNHCPICRKPVRIEPSSLFGDAPCPHCGSLLWFVSAGLTTKYFPLDGSAGVRERLGDFLAEQLGVDKEQILADPSVLKELGADSLEMVELVMALEQEEGLL